MNKEAYKVLDYARRYDPKCGVPKRQDVKVDDRQAQPDESLVKMIYSPDPVSGLPTGDLSFWVSDKVNPQVKEFILSRLMQDVSKAANAKLPDGISDEDALSMSRLPGERMDAYVERLNDQISKTLWLNDQARKSVPDGSQEPSVPSE